MFYVYAHFELDTGRLFYIGKGSGRRARSTSSRNKHWKSIVSRHGFVSVVIADGMDEAEAYKFEADTIAECEINTLATYTSGGRGISGWKHTEVARASMSAKRLGRSLSEEHRRKLSETIKSRPDLLEQRRANFNGDKNPSRTEKGREAIRIRMKINNPMNNSCVREKMIRNKTGRSLTKEHIENAASARRGKKRAPMPEKVRIILAAIQNKRKRPVETTCGLRFESTLSAANALNIRQGNIVNSCAGRQRAGGYQWRYSDPIPSIVG